jgi:hypothetical protein
MIPHGINANHARAAIAEIDEAGVPPWRESTRYHLVYEGRRYPPKYVVSMAAKQATGRELRSGEFNGGSETNTFLRGLGFDIEGSPGGFQRSHRPVPKMPREKGADHNERCQECKAAVLAVLKRL